MNKPIEFSASSAPVSGRGNPSVRPVAQSSRGNYGKGVVLCVMATLLMGIMFPVMTSALVHVDPFTFTSLRYLIAGTAFCRPASLEWT